MKKDFINVEPASTGFKLKIPNLLLKEKVRTQARFNVGTTPDEFVSHCNIHYIYIVHLTVVPHPAEHETGTAHQTHFN